MQTLYPLILFLLAASVLTAQDGPVGWASLNGGTTGGDGGEEVTATTRSELNSAISGSTPRVILVEDTIELNLYERLNVGSNKTIRGATPAAMIRFGGLQVVGNNVIIQNLSIGDSYDPADPDGKLHSTDGITIFGQNVWVDHCWLYSTADGLLDVRSGNGSIADYVTVSYTRFSDHNKVSLIGSSNNETESRGHLRVTYHHNWFDGTYGKSVVQRMPRVRFGDVHLFNNYFEDVGSYAVAARFESDLVVESNFFRNSKNPHAIEDRGLGNEDPDLVAVDNIYEGSGGDRQTGGDAFTPADFYAYTPDPVGEVPGIVMNGAGPLNPDDNQAPVAVNDSLDFTETARATIVDVLANDTDPDSDTLRIAQIDNLPAGLAIVKDNRITYIPPNSPPVEDVIRYTVVDANGGSSQAEVIIVYDASTATQTVRWQDSRIDLYPNPASAEVEVRWRAAVSERTTISVLDTYGRALPTKLVTPSASGAWRVDTRTLPVGVYTVLLQTPEATYGRRLLVAR
ncbi:Ig-like domain-containing protein [Lewinella sp. IMCC34183]|uniref:pectate lyase family protein n=1 Tax=Lewinella sp. IMCC34183 TaxID=2248762 RepID=UPI000E2520E2|nr:Ig-like domain-containing protein [Lewinella sp. IMCC34183]